MRQANSTIKGYLYQFNKSIYEILTSDDQATITLEGVIEDIDVQMPNAISTIQCKYHEDSKFTISNIAEPVLEMICHFNECSALGKETKYILFAHYSENVDAIDKDKFKSFITSTTSKEIQLDFFHKIFTITDEEILHLANKEKKSKDDKDKILNYYKSNKSNLTLCVNLDDFWNCFKYEKAESFESLKENVIQKLCEIISDSDKAKNLYYPNAFSMVAELSSKSELADRTICKANFIKSLREKESILITKWLLAATDKGKILKRKKEYLSNQFGLNTTIRAFVFSAQYIEKNTDTILPFIQEYLAKYFRKPRLHKQPLFIFDNAEIVQNIILGLHKYQKAVNSGLIGNSFVADSFINNTDCSPNFVCKVASLQNIDMGILEACKVNQVYVIGNINKSLNSTNCFSEKIEIDTIDELRYLVNLIKRMEA